MAAGRDSTGGVRGIGRERPGRVTSRPDALVQRSAALDAKAARHGAPPGADGRGMFGRAYAGRLKGELI